MKKTVPDPPPPVKEDHHKRLKKSKPNNVSYIPDDILLSIVCMLPVKEWLSAVFTISNSEGGWQRLVSLLPRCDQFSLEVSSRYLQFLPPLPRALLGRLDVVYRRCVTRHATQCNIIQQAKDVGVKELIFTCELDRHRVLIPCAVLDIKSLRLLSLRNCELGVSLIQPRLVHCMLLHTLVLLDSYIHQNILNLIFSDCPLLDFVHLEDCKGFRHVRIHSRSLKNLMILNPRKNLKSIDINAPNLKMVDIKLSPIKLQKLIIQAPKVQEASLNFSHPLQIAQDNVGGLRRFLLAAEDLKWFRLSAAATKVISKRL